TRALGAAASVVGLADGFATLGAERVEWRDAAGEVRRAFGLPDAASVALAPDGRRLAIGTRGGIVELIDPATGARTGVLVGHDARIIAIAFTPDGRRIVTAGGDHSVRVWDVGRAREVVRYVGFDSSALQLAIARDGAHVAVTCADDIRIFPLEDPAIRRVIDVHEAVGAAQLLDGGATLLVTTDSAVQLWDLRTGARRAQLAVHPFDGAHLSPDRTLIAIPIADAHDVELRDPRDGALRGRLRSTAQVTWAAFDPAGARIATANTAGDVELWARDGTRLAGLRGHTTLVQSVAFSPDGRRLISASNDRSARLWDLATGEAILRVEHSDAIDHARFDPSGARVLTAGEDRRLIVWDATTGIALHALRHVANVRSAAFSDDGTRLAGATAAGTIELWDADHDRELARFQHAAAVMAVELAGPRLVSTSIDGRIAIWDVGEEPEAGLVARVCHVLRDQLGRDDAALRCDE
ncbi:MAG TPA: WD40 repeat domain-containing protein, partial [Kofleriaceae bacterium]|nr:WD40 repeat domain-containing protein [Kofleriaceae bacterium]